MKKILIDYTAMADVTDEMRKLRECPECKGGMELPAGANGCPLCHGTGQNPDQSGWWEALSVRKGNILSDGISLLLPAQHLVIFTDWPSDRTARNIIYRPAGDNRPWPEVLKDLMYDHVRCAEEAKYDVAFALATPETAGVFKGFGIKTLVEA